MASFACGLFLALCVLSPVFGAPAGAKNKKMTKSSDNSLGLAKHYKVVTIPDKMFVVQNKTAKGGFSGPYIDLLDAFADVGNFTYDITAQADGNFGKKQANGKFNGMIGDVVNGKYDLILANIAFTKDIAQVLDGAALTINVSESVLFNPKTKSNKKDYIIQKDLNYFLMKNSDDPASKAIWTNIKGRMPGSIVASTDDAVKQVKAGKYFVSDSDTIQDLVETSNGSCAMEPTLIWPDVPVYPFATKKGADIGLFLNTLLTLVTDEEITTEEWISDIMDAMMSGGWTPVPETRRRRR